MLFKKNFIATIIAVSGLIATSQTAHSQEIDSYEDYRLYCSPAAYQYNVQSPDCDRHKNLYENRLQQELEESQIRERTAKEQSDANQNNRIKGYVGGSLGAFFPTEDVELINLDTGFGGSLFAGAKFNKNFATDIEFMLATGGTELDEVSYSQWGIFLNSKFILPLSNKAKSVAFFLSPGVGISKGKVSYDLTDADAAALGSEEGLRISIEDDLSFAWQAKLGLSVPFSNRYSGFTQVRYVNPTGENTIDLFSTELGLSVEF